MTFPYGGPFSSVHVRVLPWKPRWRDRSKELPDLSFSDLFSGGFDDPMGFGVMFVVGIVVLPLLVVGLPILYVFGFGLLVLLLELVVLAALSPLLMVGQLAGLLPWVIVLRAPEGARHGVQVRGTRQMLAARRYYRTLLVSGSLR